MSLSPGQSLSHYRLGEAIGEGGMGVVWRATDTTLHRDVAIKVLPDLFARDPERLARFEREARLLAALNHPHIASIYGLHSVDSVRFLAMELVEGEDLAERLKRGPIPVAEILPIALQIAQALEHAHERGIVHRDLKPANVQLTPSGDVKVLDFGLARALEGDPSRPSSGGVTMSQSPTITGHLTGVNVLLGTAAYMSPEQARGQAADRRADIWAFGVVLMEMLTAKRVFDGETISDTLATVLKTDPDWSTLPKDTPMRIRTLLKRCLDRDPKRRLRDIGEARIVLEEVIAGKPDEPGAAAATTGNAKKQTSVAVMLLQVVAVSLATVLATKFLGPKESKAPLVKFRLTPPASVVENIRSSSISPDGRMIAYVTGDRLWIQSLGELEPREQKIDPTATALFWSPDAKYIGYIAGGRVMRMSVDGSDAQAICEGRGFFSGGMGATWGDKSTIVFSRADSGGLLVVPAVGGDPRTYVLPDTNESDLHEPSFLPGERGVLYAGHRRRGGVNNVMLWANGRRKILREFPNHLVSSPVYSPTGHILFRRSPGAPGIWAMPFSLSRLEVTGEPFLVVPNGGHPTASRNGWLACLASDVAGSTQLVWMNREGRELGTIAEGRLRPNPYPALASSGTRVALSESDNDNESVYIYDTTRGTRGRLTFDDGLESWPDWSPDGERIAFHATAKGCSSADCFFVLMRSAYGTGSVDTIGQGAGPTFTPDGRSLLFVTFDDYSNWNLSTVPLDGARHEPITLIRGNPYVIDGRVRPSGDLMAYISNESGDWQVYLTRFPSCEGRWQVSAAGGQWPRWNSKGDRLYYAQGDDIMEVEVSGTGSPNLGRPVKLFTRSYMGPGVFGLAAGLAVTKDGSKFVTAVPSSDRQRQGITVVQNWAAEFTRKK